MSPSRSADDIELLAFLQGQRDSVLAVVADLDESLWHTPVLPSGWTVAGLVEHLADAEQHWFQQVLTGVSTELAYDEGRPPYRPNAAFTTHHTSAEVRAHYGEMCAESDTILGRTALDAAPVGSHGGGQGDPIRCARTVVLHIIEETAAHSGHLEIARELLDGRTGLGLR